MTGENSDKPVLPSGVIVSPVPMPGMIDIGALSRTVDAQEKLGQAQTRAQATDQALRELNAGTDADFVQTDDRFEAWSHDQIYDAVNGVGGMDVAGMQTLKKVWYDAYSELANLSTFNQLSISRLLGNGEWAGASGDAARDASSTFGKVANQISQVFSAMANRMDAVAWAAEATRAAVPAPATAVTTLNPDDPLSSIIPGLANPETATQSREASEQARLAVVATMNQIYKPSFPPSGSGVPSYANVASVVTGGDVSLSGVTGAGDRQSAGGANGSPSTGSPPEPGALTTDSPADLPSETPASSDLNAGGDDSTTAASATPSAGSPTATTPAINTPAAQTSPSALALGTPGAATLGGAARPGAGAGSGGGARSGTPSPGKPVAGTPSNLTGSQSSAAGGSRAGGPGAFGPMMPGGASRKTDDDAEHRTPDYLRRVQSEWTAGISTLSGVIGSDGLPLASRAEPFPPAAQVAPPAGPTQREAPVVAPRTDLPPDPTPPVPSPAAPAGDPAAEMARLIAQYGWANGGQRGQASSTTPDAGAK
ncbi:hypothetical protein [Nocardia fluminea]|uniref:hypothetical protein n=1 Tax=Nocardia fluminea TaxID=134984 RepID=UPI00364D8EC8